MSEHPTYINILKASKKLFACHGFNKTSTHMIADEVGIKKPSLYYFFKNKEKIYVCILEELFNDTIHLFKKSLDDKVELEKCLEALFSLSKKNGPFIFSAHSLEKESVEKMLNLFQELTCSMHYYLSCQELRINDEDALRIILDTSQMYAQRIAEHQPTISPAEYAALLTKLFKK